MELLDIVDENGQPTGEVVDREFAHRNGIRHRTSHVWVSRVKRDCRKNIEEITFNDLEMMLQRRSDTKDSNPGKLDISSAGHIKAGTGYVDSAIRELQEELGITATPSELIFCGKKRVSYMKKFYGEEFFDNQVSNVYIMYKDIDAADIKFQVEEVSEVLWMPFTDIYNMVMNKSEDSCISEDEMYILENYLNDNISLLLAKK